MAEQKIEFRKIRDFGENLNDTFQFIKLNFKPLLKSFFAICALFMLSQAIFNVIYQSRFIGIWQGIIRGSSAGNFNFGQIFNLQYFLVIFLALLTYISMQVALGSYVKYYVENEGKQPGIDEVWAIFSRNFFRVLLYSIPVMLGLIIGFCFCLVPGVYLWVVFVPFSMVTIMEDTDFVTTYYRCFELVKDNFWISFGIYLIAYLIYYFSWAILGAIISAFLGLGTYLTTSNLTTTLNVITSFLNVFSFCFYMIFLVSVALNYFSLVEKKDATGILNRIGNIGKEKNDIDNIEEQY